MGLRLPDGILPEDRHAQWIRVVERIKREQIDHGWRHQIFRLMRAVFSSNDELSHDGGFLFNWMAANYVDASLMLVRRELDVQPGTENLRNLLEDIIDHPEVLTRARYRGQWGSENRDMADRVFDSFEPVRTSGRPEADYINPAIVKADLTKAVDAGERVRRFAERTRAHRTPERGIDRSLTFQDLHKAIDDIREIVGKYYSLLALSTVINWEPTAQYDQIAPFTKPWVRDTAAVERARDADPGDPG